MAPTHKEQKVYVWNVDSALKLHNAAVVAVSFASQKAFKEKQSENTCLEMCCYQSARKTEGHRPRALERFPQSF